MPSPDDLIPAPAVPAELLALAQTRDPADIARASYRRIWTGMSNGQIPSIRIGSRLFARRSELPAIARALGLEVPALGRPSPPARRAPA